MASDHVHEASAKAFAEELSECSSEKSLAAVPTSEAASKNSFSQVASDH